jgi:hypothetical protein
VAELGALSGCRCVRAILLVASNFLSCLNAMTTIARWCACRVPLCADCVARVVAELLESMGVVLYVEDAVVAVTRPISQLLQCPK